jgi:nucleoside-diphosphate-sugar epimerase
LLHARTHAHTHSHELNNVQAAENAWLATGLPVVIFRLPGIYGPGRGPLSKVRSGTARRLIKRGQIFSRVHVDDIVQTVLASATWPRAGAVYNVVDDEPGPAHEVITFACALLGVEPPPLVPFEKAELSPMALSFYEECRFIRNALIKRELGVKPMYVMLNKTL